jgi:phosphate butyryltransferase
VGQDEESGSVRITSFAQLTEAARQAGPRTVAVAAAQEHEVLLAAIEAQQLGLARCILVGDQNAIEALAREAGADLGGAELVNEPDPVRAASQAMKLVRSGAAHIAMKGRVETRLFLHAALDKELGLRTDRLLTHVAAFEIPGFPRLVIVSDAGVVVAPTLEQKVEIVQNAIFAAQRLGIDRPKVAILAANEMVNAKVPVSLDAANLSKMADRGQIKGGLIDGPLALDNAVSKESARIKGIQSDVAGEADVLITPDLESGNILIKSITYFANGVMAGVVVGARAPLVLPSRADSHQAKLMSIAFSVLLAG